MTFPAYEKFTLHIELGNDAMQTATDVAGALRIVETQLCAGKEFGKILDVNGNSVGRWSL